MPNINYLNLGLWRIDEIVKDPYTEWGSTSNISEALV